jgi:hypothetical protein
MPKRKDPMHFYGYLEGKRIAYVADLVGATVNQVRSDWHIGMTAPDGEFKTGELYTKLPDQPDRCYTQGKCPLPAGK